MDHAHRNNVIHRDLRPGNVLVSEKGLVKVADFGTSRVLEIAAHGTTVIGSPPYMAPEQFRGKAVFGSDLYSLGVTMYQMLTGVLPYETPAPGDIEKLMTGELVSPPKLKNPKIPKAVNDIVLKALAPDLGVRYQRASELLADIMALGARRLVPSPRASGRRRVGRGRPVRGDAGHPFTLAGARSAAGAFLLALQKAPPRPLRSLPVLRRSAVDAIIFTWRRCRTGPTLQGCRSGT